MTTYAANYGAPKTERASLGLTRRITNRITFNVDASYVRGIGQAASKDLNLNPTPKFELGGADGRPVYADPTQIDTISGQVPLSASRIDPNFGAVSNVFSSLSNETKQVTFNLSGTTNKQMQLNLAYTYMQARDRGRRRRRVRRRVRLGDDQWRSQRLYLGDVEQSAPAQHPGHGVVADYPGVGTDIGGADHVRLAVHADRGRRHQR